MIEITQHFFIWSNEHLAWWKPAWRGYTQDINEAGRYSIEEAITICQQANFSLGRNEKAVPNEAIVPIPTEKNV